MKSAEQFKSLIEMIKRNHLRIDIDRLIDSDYNTDSPYGIYYSATYAGSTFVRHQFIWFDKLEKFKDFLFQQIPVYYAIDLDCLSDDVTTDDLYPYIERYFKSLALYGANMKAFRNSIEMMLKINDYKALQGAIDKFLGVDTIGKKVLFKVEWIGEREGLLNTDRSSIKYLRDEIKKDFEKSETEFPAFFYNELYFMDFIQKSFEDLTGFEAFKYDSYIKLHNKTENDPIGITMMKNIFSDYADSVGSKFLKDFITEKYVNFKRYK